jgi:hypothetical protein
MTTRFACALCFVAVTAIPLAKFPGSAARSLVLHAAQGAPQAVASSSTAVSAASTTGARSRHTLERFLADTESFTSLVSYRAVRRLSVVARGGKMKASLTVRTSLDPLQGFTYEVLEESGSGLLRSRVLHGALEAESEAKRRQKGAHGSLSAANYTFEVADWTSDGLLQVAIHPKRKDSLLMDGSIFLTGDAADLVRMEGLLVKRPSFWTRKVHIDRHYGRIQGVRVPVTMGSTADILFAGQSTFTMDYEYESINGVPVTMSATER